MRLTTKAHDRDAAGMTYVYPVVSRRAQGVSVGINLNPNNACNWRCVYCQVPNLSRGKGPEVDLALLERELESMLDSIVNGTFLVDHVPAEARRLNDVAFSGNGEPTSSPQFAAAVELLGRVLERFGLRQLKTVLITNGSLVHLPAVAQGIERLNALGGEVWYKVDGGSDEAIERINDVTTGAERARRNLVACTSACSTWVQTMVFARGGAPPSEQDCADYVAFLHQALAAGARPEGVLLYGLARPSHQPEASELSPLPKAWITSFAERIRATGLEVRVFL